MAEAHTVVLGLLQLWAVSTLVALMVAVLMDTRSTTRRGSTEVGAAVVEARAVAPATLIRIGLM